MPTIANTGINPGPGDVWGDGMQTWEVTLDDGQSCTIYRKQTSPPLVVGQEIEITGTTKQGGRKGKVPSAGGSYGSSSSGGASAPKGEFRSPDQIIRSTAIGVAASFLASGVADASAAINVASQFESYIRDGAHFPAGSAPSPAAPGSPAEIEF